MFCDFFERSSRFGSICENAFKLMLFDKTLLIPFKLATSDGLSDDDGDLLLFRIEFSLLWLVGLSRRGKTRQ